MNKFLEKIIKDNFSLLKTSKFKKMECSFNNLVYTINNVYIIKYARENGYNSIHLTCLDNAYNAHKLYESIGMKRASSVKYAIYFNYN